MCMCERGCVCVCVKEGMFVYCLSACVCECIYISVFFGWCMFCVCECMQVCVYKCCKCCECMLKCIVYKCMYITVSKTTIDFYIHTQHMCRIIESRQGAYFNGVSREMRWKDFCTSER